MARDNSLFELPDGACDPAASVGLVGAILAGGASRRMGRPKEAVPLADGRPMIAHVIDALRSIGVPVVVVGACSGVAAPWPWPDVHRLDDSVAGQGPLGGLATLLASRLGSAYLVVGCDQPYLAPSLLRRLVDASEPTPSQQGVSYPRGRFFRMSDGAQFDPFPGLFPASWAMAAAADLRAGQRSVRRFLRTHPIDWVIAFAEDVPLLQSLNTPGDLATATSLVTPPSAAVAGQIPGKK